MAEGDGSDPSEPYVKYADDEKKSNTYVRVNVFIKGLKKGTFTRPRLAQPANGSVSLDVTERTICLKASIDTNGAVEKWEYRVKELPEDIFTDREKTYWKIKQDGEVVLMLCKAKPGSWVKYLSSSGPGLDQADS